MDDLWPVDVHRWERIRRARLQAGFERIKDAADSLGVRPGTYRTWEVGPSEGGREPPLTEIQRMAKKYKVSWIWLATGEGDPRHDILSDERMAAFSRKAAQVADDKKDDAMAAAMAVLEAFTRKAG